MDTIQKTVATLPHSPGVYLFKDKEHTVIYVGKAKNLHKRVSSYFASSTLLSEKTKQLVTHIHTIQTIHVATEFESLLLEAKLIRTYNPKYNSISKDDKSPIYININTTVPMPTVQLSRMPKNTPDKKNYYFGPFATRKTAQFILSTLRNSIPFCQQKVRNGKPCFYTHIGLCNPCPSMIHGLPDSDLKKLYRAQYRKNIQRLLWIVSGKSRTAIHSLEKDMRHAADSQKFEEAASLHKQIQMLIMIINNKYDPFIFESTDPLEKVPEEQIDTLSTILQKHIPIQKPLHRIECYDISTLQGTNSVGSMVVMIDGIPHTNQYRRFQIKTVYAMSDVDMMKEVVTRRFHHAEWEYPDLIVVDGGKGQVSHISTLLQTLHIDIPVIGLSKRFEQIVVQSQHTFKLITIPLASPALQLLQHIRDEAHRFAITYHKKLRKQSFAQ